MRMPLLNLYFLAFEILVLVLFLACLQNAWQRGSWVAWQLLAGVLFGLLLELATIQQLNAYKYGCFLVMLGPVPVVVGVAWGTIIYSVRSFSDKTNLPEWARPVLDGLMALNIDLSMDAIAIRLGMVLGCVLIFSKPSIAIKAPWLLGTLVLPCRSYNLRHYGRAYYQ